MKKKLIALILSLALCLSLLPVYRTASAANVTQPALTGCSVTITDVQQGTMESDGYGALSGTVVTLAMTFDKVPWTKEYFSATLKKQGEDLLKVGGTMPFVTQGEDGCWRFFEGDTGPNGETVTDNGATLTVEKTVCINDATSPDTSGQQFGAYGAGDPIVVEFSASTIADNGDAWNAEPVMIEIPASQITKGKTFTAGGAATATLGDLSNATVTISSAFPDNTFYWDGTAVTPSVSVWMGEEFLYEDDDYTVTYSDNEAPGTGLVTVDALAGGRVTGSTTAEFTIKELSGDLSNPSNAVLLFDEDWNQTNVFQWTGSPVEPNVMVELDGNVTLTGQEFTVTYSDNTDPGIATVTLKGNGEKSMGVPITGERTVQFQVAKGDSECPHKTTTGLVDTLLIMNSDGKDGTHNVVCNLCKEILEANVSHVWFKTLDGTYICNCGASYKGEGLPSLNDAKVTGLKEEEGAVYTKEEAESTGLEGLAKGTDYIQTVTGKEKDGKGIWVVENKPVEGKSEGEKAFDLPAHCKHEMEGFMTDTLLIMVTDGKDGTHNVVCSLCKEILEKNVAHKWFKTLDGTYICNCGASYKEDGLPSLNDAKVTGLKEEEGAVYTKEEAENTGLEGLIKGTDYIQTITGKEKGEKGVWIIEDKAVEGKTEGEISFDLPMKCLHELDGAMVEQDLVMVTDGVDGTHNVVCHLCREVLKANQKHIWFQDPETGAYICNCGASFTGALPGDVTGDGIFDGRDSVRLMKYLAGETDPETGEPVTINKENADMDGNGTIDELDLIRIVNNLAGNYD